MARFGHRWAYRPLIGRAVASGAGAALSVSVNDAVTASEAVTLTNTTLGGVSVNDAVGVAESVSRTLVGNVSVSESVGVHEGQDKVLNGDFETRAGDDFSNWTDVPSGSSTVTAETTVVYSGSAAVKLTVDSSNSLVYILQEAAFACSPGQQYTLLIRAKSDSAGQLQYDVADDVTGGSPNYLQADGTWNSTINRFAIDTTTAWQTFMKTFTTDSGQTTLGIRELKRSGGASSKANRVFYVDLVQIIEHPFPSVRIDENEAVNDAVSVSESVTARVSLEPNVNEAVSVSESLTVANAQLGPVSVNDAVSAAEDLTARVDLNPGVLDAVGVAESVSVTNTTLGAVAVNDGVGVSD